MYESHLPVLIGTFQHVTSFNRPDTNMLIYITVVEASFLPTSRNLAPLLHTCLLTTILGISWFP
jgi:hypothetical protein